jgi:hypothetical protein
VTFTEPVVREAQVSEHFVQLCDSSESMSAAAGAFLADAHRAGDNLLIVARDANWIVAMNAATKLSELSRNGMPHQGAFDGAIGQPVRDFAARGRLSIYGEMVDVLAQRDEVDAAVALEGMWNDLAERTSFRLMCGYSSAHFVSRGAEVRLRDVCRAHTHVRSDESDPLGGWLLQRSRVGFAPGSPHAFRR